MEQPDYLRNLPYYKSRLFVRFTHYRIDRPDHDDGVGNERAFHHVLQSLKGREVGRLVSHAPRPTGAVGNHVEAQLTLRCLDGVVAMRTFRRRNPHVRQQEVVNHTLHRIIDFLLGGIRQAAVVRPDRARHVLEPFQTLTNDFDALTHLFQTHEVPGQRVTFGSKRDNKINLVVLQIRLEVADVVLDAARPNVRSRQAKLQGFLRGYRPDTLVTVKSETLSVDDFLPSEKLFRESIRKVLDPCEGGRDEVVGVSPDAGV